MSFIQRHSAVTLFICVAVIGLILAPRIGPAWDEPDNIFSAGVYVNFFSHHMDPSYFQILTDKASAYGNRIVPNDHLLSHLPPFHNFVGILFVLAAAVAHIATTAPVIIISWHLSSVLFLALLVATTYRFGILLGLSGWTSLAAALLTCFYPQIFGHGLSNSKDIAQAAMVTVSLYYLIRGTVRGGKGTRDIIFGAVAWGLGLATKFNAVYVPIVWGIWVIVSAFGSVRIFGASVKQHNLLTAFVHTLHDGAEKRVPPRTSDKISSLASHLLLDSLLIFFVGLATTYLVWPYLWLDPIGHFREMVIYFMSVGRGYPVIWNGVLYTVGTGKSLWWYPWASFIVTTPLPVLMLVLVGIGGWVRFIRQKPLLLLLPIWILVPLLRTLSPWTAFYDELRHFLEIIPAFMLIAALALEWIYTKSRSIAWGLAIIVIADLIWITMTLFPYSTGYYNSLAPYPNTNFDRDIEGLSIKEGIDWTHAAYGNISLWVPIAAHLSWYYLTPRDRYVYALGQADTVILINKASHKIDTQYRDFEASSGAFTLAHTIRRGDAIFGWVYRKTTAAN